MSCPVVILFLGIAWACLFIFILVALRKSEAALKKSTNFTRALLNTIPFGLHIVDAEGKIMYANQAIENTFKVPLIGRKCWEVYRDEKKRCDPCPLEAGPASAETGMSEAQCSFGGKTFIVKHSGMVYEGKRALMEAFIDISDRKKIEDSLQRALKAKSVFTSMISHELRTPLTAIQEGVSIVLDGEAGQITDEQKDFLEIAKRNVARLKKLINEVLDFQKIETGKLALKKEEHDLNAVVQEVYENTLLLAQGKGLNLIVKNCCALPKIKLDKGRIIQVLENLVSNAVKFTEKGSVTIAVEKGDNFVHISVADTGPGIGQADLPRLFREFEQLETGLDHKTGGTGLGLIISKEIIEGHNGKIWAESEVGKGTTFHFVLPIAERRG
jgi:PAS domain S-box-containing protein